MTKIEQFQAFRKELLAEKSGLELRIAELDAARRNLVTEVDTINSTLGIQTVAVKAKAAGRTPRRSDFASQILGKMECNIVYTPKGLAAAMNEDAVTIGLSLRQLMDDGAVARVDHGQYVRKAAAVVAADSTVAAVSAADESEIVTDDDDFDPEFNDGEEFEDEEFEDEAFEDDDNDD